MLGGGIFTTQTKVLPGAYINFVSTSSASSILSGRGVVTMPLELDWGPEGMFEISQEDFLDDARPILGYRATDTKMAGLYDLFKKAKTLYAYRVGMTGAAAAACDLCAAKYKGVRGNDISVAVEENTNGTFDVTTYLDGSKVDTQTVTKAEELEDNDYVIWASGITLAALTATALTGGASGTATAGEYSDYMDTAESYSFNIMATTCTDAAVQKVFAAYVERMRDTYGVKFQTVLYQYPGDYEGIINVHNPVTDGASEADLVYWVAGAEAAAGTGESLINALYTGGFKIKLENTQTALKSDIKNGYFTFHNVDGQARVLYDINSLTTLSKDKGEVFQDNKTIRVCDEIANGVALLFARDFLGQVPNDDDGRVALWNEIVDLHYALVKTRAIQNFDSADITVSQGEGKNDVLVTEAIEVTGTMAKLYMIVTVS